MFTFTRNPFMIGICRTAAASLLALFACAAHGAEPLVMYQAVLMQPGAVIEKRVVSVDAMAAYIKTVEAAARAALDGAEQKPTASGFIVVALRPGQRSNAWLDLDVAIPEELSNTLITKIRRVMPIRVKEGPVVFALRVGLWGGKEQTQTLPNPAEWKAAQQQSLAPLEPGELVEKIWKD